MAYTSAQKAFCSSSTSVCPWRYDVFLSFRGKDTRFNFTDHLYTTLVHKGIKTFRDDTLKRGEEIGPEILKAIEESRFSIVVFSENYANPSDVQKQMGSFGEAFSRWWRKSSANLWILAMGVREAAPD
ncbi:hypothetical protein AAG906_026748 [Vitis piasezkii]